MGEKVSKFSPKVPNRAVRTAFYVTRGWILWKKFLEVYSSLIFSDTEQIFSDFMRRVLCRIINYAFYAPKGSFWEIFLVKICAPHSRISSDHRCRFIAQNFLVGLSNLNPKSVQMILFQKKTCWNIYQFLFFGRWAVTSQTFDTKKGLVCWNCPLRFQKFFLRKFFSPEKIYLSVSDFELMIFVLLFKKFGRLTKTALYVSRGDFRRKKSFELKSIFSISLWNWADDFQDSGDKCRKHHQS